MKYSSFHFTIYKWTLDIRVNSLWPQLSTAPATLKISVEISDKWTEVSSLLSLSELCYVSVKPQILSNLKKLMLCYTHFMDKKRILLSRPINTVVS